jgi:NAD(P)H-dependent FMN reductase
MRLIRILAISGSLRRASTNSAVVRAVARLASGPVHVTVYDELELLPPFNPDVDENSADPVVARFRFHLGAAHGLVISSPEYAHGVPGVLKNALDWVVGSSELAEKPVALINASPRATHAWASLAETLTVMSAHVVPEASVTLPLQGRSLDALGIVEDPVLAATLLSAIEALTAAARQLAVHRAVSALSR